MVIRWYRAKAVRLIEAYGFSHFWWKGIETHFQISFSSSFRNELFYQTDADALAAKAVSNKKALHLTDSVLELSHSDAARELVVHQGEKQPALRLHILPWQLSNLPFIILKAKVHAV